MTTFTVKRVSIPLFNHVEAETEEWFSAFAADSNVSLQLDNTALEFVADELEIDANGLVLAAKRYVAGEFRSKTKGMAGGQLGDLGEILTCLLWKADGRPLVRIVGHKRAPNQTVKGSRFPEPDFVFKDNSGKLAALEVKATQAFNYIKLSTTPKNWMHLHPCSGAAKCRVDALPQLGFKGNTPTEQKHLLKERVGKLVPFPAENGVAVAVLAVDGRVDKLRCNRKFKTPPECRKKKRDCWKCIPESCDFAVVTMPNSPGRLSLAGGSRGSAKKWLGAYHRWTQALAAHDLFAVRETLSELGDAVTAWLEGGGVEQPDVLRAFWGSYLTDVMRVRGFDVEAPQNLGNLQKLDPNSNWTQAPLPEHVASESDITSIRKILDNSDEFLGSFSARLSQTETVSLHSDGNSIECYFSSASWWNEEDVSTAESALMIAARLLVAVLDVPEERAKTWIEFRSVDAKVGEKSIGLGWDAKVVDPDYESWRRLLIFGLRGEPHWLALLAVGDPRVRLRVLRDGRALLRIRQPLLRRD